MTRPEKGAPGPTAIGARGQEKHQPAQSTESPPDLQTAEKRFERLRALLALKGHELYATADGYLVQRWGLTKDLTGIDAVEAFARQVGAV